MWHAAKVQISSLSGDRQQSQHLVLANAVTGNTASMRPRPLSRGNFPDRHGAVRQGHASMRPRPLSRGNGERHAVERPEGRASMRPRPLSRGNRICRCGHGTAGCRFNEAAAVKPRKLIAVVVAAEGNLCASMRPRPLSRGNTGHADVPLFRPVQRASMRPRPLSRGNTFMRPPLPARSACFNEAAAVKPRKLEN